MSNEQGAAAAAANPAAGKATVRYSVQTAISEEFVGMTVAQARAKQASKWSVPGDAAAYKGKVKMEDSYVIQPGDSLEFHRRQGEKGE